MTQDIERPTGTHPSRPCANIRCGKAFVVTRPDKAFCCRECKTQWKNLVRSACTVAAELLIEHRMQPRMSKSERKIRTERAKRLGKEPPPLPKRGLLTKAFREIDIFISAERTARDNPNGRSGPRPHELRD